MKNKLFNSEINKNSFFGSPVKFTEMEERQIFAGLFEQLLLFDEIILGTDKNNQTLVLLISKLGLDVVERLVRSGYIKFSIKSAAIFTGTGHQREDGTTDESVIYNQPPIVGGSLTGDDTNPDVNVYRALKRFGVEKKERNRLIKKFSSSYIQENSLESSSNTAKLIIDAYEHNNLENLGLPFKKDPMDLNLQERNILFKLGHKVLDASLLAKNGYKSYNNYEHLEISKKNYENIGKAYNISQNASEIFKVENTPNLKDLYLHKGLEIKDVFNIRHLSSAKYFRKWMNTVGENANSAEVTEAYLNEIAGTNKFFETGKGKFLKNTFVFGATTGLGGLIAGELGVLIGSGAKTLVEPVVDYSLGLLDEFVLGSVLEGKSPKTYIDKLKAEVNK